MPLYDVFFYGSFFFLIGVFLSSVGINIYISFWVALFIGAFFFILYSSSKNEKKLWIALLCIFIFAGSAYYRWDNLRFISKYIPFNEKISVIGVVSSDPKIKEETQEIVVEVSDFGDSKILLKTDIYPRYSYKDTVRISGKIKKPFPDGYEKYLAKEGIKGTISFPKINLISKKKNFSLKGFLIGIKHSISNSFSKLLPKKEATFLTGITLGGSSGFSKEFKEAMKKSGTTHIVALSGYNITIIAWVMFSIFSYFLSRRFSFIFTSMSIIAFVGIAGAEASIVRAAIMGLLILMAREMGRIYDFRNAIIFTGLIMVLVNPKVLVFDVGFQLSFLAFLGIIYLRPVLMRIFKISEKSAGFLSWKDNFFTTFSAQLAVLPILLISFGEISLSSIISNTLILPLVPVTMAIGFIVAIISFFSYFGALIISWPALILLKIKIFVIEFFADHGVFLHFKSSPIIILIYYSALSLFTYFITKKKTILQKEYV